MKVCVLQSDPALGCENLRILGRTIAEIPADLYVLPELFKIGFDALSNVFPATAEIVPDGSTYQLISQWLQCRPTAVVVCGMLEQDRSAYYNIAAVIGYGWMERYRQKYPARTAGGRVLPVLAGDFRKVWLPFQTSIGLMVCHDHYASAEFFEEYKKRSAETVVLIADSTSRDWMSHFPALCKEKGLSAIICNAAGENKGGSCILNRTGDFLSLHARGAQFLYLPECPMTATASLG